MVRPRTAENWVFSSSIGWLARDADPVRDVVNNRWPLEITFVWQNDWVSNGTARGAWEGYREADWAWETREGKGARPRQGGTNRVGRIAK